jgi:hypothetical protein
MAEEITEVSIQPAEEKVQLAPTVPIEKVIALFEEHQRFVREALVEGIDYGRIEGIDKPFLFKSGAEKLLLWHGLTTGEPELDARYETIDGVTHLSVFAKVRIADRNGMLRAVGVGYASTLEPQYRWTKEFRSGEQEPEGGGWQRTKRKDSGAPMWTRQVPNPDVARYFNTVLKMAVKRALVDGALRATATSGLFSQDEDEVDIPREPRKAQAEPQALVCVGCRKPITSGSVRIRDGIAICDACTELAERHNAKYRAQEDLWTAGDRKVKSLFEL